MTEADFHSALLDANRAVPSGLLDGHQRPAGRRFDVYRNNIAASLQEALETGFPATAALLGERNFTTLAQGYLRANPPSSPLMMLYGGRFPAYLARIPALAKMGYLPEVAQLEYALRQSYHAADAAPLNPDSLARLTPEQLNGAVLHFAPATRLVPARYPILAIYDRALGHSTATPPGHSQPCLVTRSEFDPSATALSPEQAALIRALMAGKSLSLASLAHPEADLAAVLTLLLTQQALTEITIKDTP